MKSSIDNPIEFMHKLPEAISKYVIIPQAGGSCDYISDNGKNCSKTWQFKSIKGNTYDCKKYCIDHCDVWLKSFFNDKIYEKRGYTGLYSDNSKKSISANIELNIVNNKDIILKYLTILNGKERVFREMKSRGIQALKSKSLIIKIVKYIYEDDFTIFINDDKSENRIYETEGKIPKNFYTDMCTLIKNNDIISIYFESISNQIEPNEAEYNEEKDKPLSYGYIYNLKSNEQSKGWIVSMRENEFRKPAVMRKYLFIENEVKLEEKEVKEEKEDRIVDKPTELKQEPELSSEKRDPLKRWKLVRKIPNPLPRGEQKLDKNDIL